MKSAFVVISFPRCAFFPPPTAGIVNSVPETDSHSDRSLPASRPRNPLAGALGGFIAAAELGLRDRDLLTPAAIFLFP